MRVEKFNIVQIGVGRWGKVLYDHFVEDERFNILQICDSKSNLDEVFNNDEVDAVVIATPNNIHAELVIRSLKSGKHVFCEKPLALEYNDVLKIKKLAKEKNKIVFTDYLYTVSKALQNVKNLVDSKYLGKLENIKLVSHQKNTDGNVYWLLISHMLSILHMFVPLDQWICEKFVFGNDITQPSAIIIRGQTFDNKMLHIYINLNYHKKERIMTFECVDGDIVFNAISGEITLISKSGNSAKICKYDETNNLELTLDKFYDCLCGTDMDNLESSGMITKKISDIINK
jgi:hypothetical protein